MFRERQNNAQKVIVICPLTSLIDDQLSRLEQMNVKAMSIDMNGKETRNFKSEGSKHVYFFQILHTNNHIYIYQEPVLHEL